MRNSYVIWFLMAAFALAAGCGGEGAGNDGGMDGGNDAGAMCGNGEVEGDEACDDGADNSDTAADACRSDCTSPICGDGVVDTDEECEGDNQCENCESVAVCGDEVVGGNEECDGEEGCFPEGHVNECMWERTAFRMKDLAILDPGIYSLDTNLALLVSGVLAETTREDRGPGTTAFVPIESLDGLIDLGFVFTFGAFDQSIGAEMTGSFVVSDCTRLDRPSPVPNPTPCAPTVTADPFAASFSGATQSEGTCLEPVADTTDFAVPSVTAGDFGCWVSAPFDFSVILGSIVQFPLTATQIAAQWDADPARNMVKGLVRGFISKAKADTIFLPPDLEFIGGQSLTTTFHTQHLDERNDEPGFWVYLSFAAELVPWEGGLMCGNATVDEEELCDVGIESGEGACSPLLDCDDELECTQDTVNAGDSCAPTCFHRVIDGTDTCVETCGDGEVQEWEICDTESEENPCDDPAVVCDDGDPCTRDLFKKPSGPGVLRNICTVCTPGTCTRCANRAIAGCS